MSLNLNQSLNKVVKVKNKPIIFEPDEVESLKFQIRKTEAEIKKLTQQKQTLQKKLREARVNRSINRPRSKSLWLYVLLLEGGRYYVGMTTNVDRRFKQHQGDKRGAVWTKKYRPISVIYRQDTGIKDPNDVSILENELTIEYARMYGTENVRGGGFCQSKPKWPLIAYEPIVEIQ